MSSPPDVFYKVETGYGSRLKRKWTWKASARLRRDSDTSLLDQFDAFMQKANTRKLGQTMEFGANTAITSLLDNPAEAMRRADRDARLPVGRYMGFSVFIDPSLASGAWQLRGQGRVEMAKSTFCQLTL